jgi:hypothetical protein
MANTKISALTAASTLGGTESFPCVQGGANRQASSDQIRTYTLASLDPAVAAALVRRETIIWPGLYGATGDGVVDDTGAVETALAATPAGGTIVLAGPAGTKYLLANVDIDRNVRLVFSPHVRWTPTSTSALVRYSSTTDWLEIDGLKVDEAVVGTGKLNALISYTSGGPGRLKVHNCDLRHVGITIRNGAVPDIQGNRWAHDNTVQRAEGVSGGQYISISPGSSGALTTFLRGGIVAHNYLKVYCPDSGNYDLVSVAAMASGIKVHDNWFENTNAACYCECDLFSGSHKASFHDNTLIGVSFARKSETPDGYADRVEDNYDTVHDNTIEIPSGYKQERGAFLAGAFFRFCNNSIILGPNTGNSIAVAGLLLEDADVNDDTFASKTSKAYIISGNIINGLAAPQTGSRGIFFRNVTNDNNAYGIIAMNIFLGFTDLCPQEMNDIIYGMNIWYPLATADQFTGWRLGDRNVAIGNMIAHVNGVTPRIDDGMPTSHHQNYTAVTGVVSTATSTTINADAGSHIRLAAGTSGGTLTITGVDNGREMQELSCFVATASVTLTHSTGAGKIRVQGATNYTCTQYEVFRLKRIDTEWWLMKGT